MTIEFLEMEGCPNVSDLWQALQSALIELKLNLPVIKLDLLALSEKHDLRTGFGSPTIIVNGKDLFDAPLPETFHPSCRYYSHGLPDTKEIVSKLKVYLEDHT